MGIERLVLAGVNHFELPVTARERAAVAEQRLPETLRGLMEAAGLEEAVVLSTCSRVEVVGTAAEPAGRGLMDWFLRRAGPEAAAGMYLKSGEEALLHLIRVSAGLDSWIVGESEIQGQVKRAYQAACGSGTTGPLLNRVFQGVMAASKAVRARTGVQTGIRSIGGAAALLSQRIFSGRERGRVVVFGAGEAAEAVLRHLAAKDFKEIWVANRTLERARAVAEPLGGRAVPFEDGMRMLSEVEAAVFSTACPRPLLDAAILGPVVAGRPRPLFVIDLGLPRNVAPDCGRLPGVYLYDLDDLKEIVRGSMSRKAREKERAESLAVAEAAARVEELRRWEAGRPRLCATA